MAADRSIGARAHQRQGAAVMAPPGQDATGRGDIHVTVLATAGGRARPARARAGQAAGRQRAREPGTEFRRCCADFASQPTEQPTQASPSRPRPRGTGQTEKDASRRCCAPAGLAARTMRQNAPPFRAKAGAAYGPCWRDEAMRFSIPSISHAQAGRMADARPQGHARDVTAMSGVTSRQDRIGEDRIGEDRYTNTTPGLRPGAPAEPDARVVPLSEGNAGLGKPGPERLGTPCRWCRWRSPGGAEWYPECRHGRAGGASRAARSQAAVTSGSSASADCSAASS